MLDANIRKDQKLMLQTALKNIQAAIKLSNKNNSFALDGSVDDALKFLTITIDRFID